MVRDNLGGEGFMGAYRKEKIASAIRHVVCNAIARRLNDPRVASLTTVTRVEMTKDLLVARVFLTVHGSDAVERNTLRAIRHAGGFIRRLVAESLTMRTCPELRFEIDEMAKGVLKTLAILAENRRREPELFETEQVSENVDVDDSNNARGDESGARPGVES